MLFAVCAVLSLGPLAEEAFEPKPLKVLAIGDRCSLSALKQTTSIAGAYGCNLELASLSIDGCSLERHWQNVVASTNSLFRPYRYDRVGEGGSKRWFGCANIPEVLQSQPWDVVTIQQCSPMSWDAASYRPCGDNLVKKIRELAPQAEILVQETWSYPSWDKRLATFGFDSVEMYAKLHDATAAFAKTHGLRIIPTGTAAAFCPDRERLFTNPQAAVGNGTRCD